MGEENKGFSENSRIVSDVARPMFIAVSRGYTISDAIAISAVGIVRNYGNHVGSYEEFANSSAEVMSDNKTVTLAALSLRKMDEDPVYRSRMEEVFDAIMGN